MLTLPYRNAFKIIFEIMPGLRVLRRNGFNLKPKQGSSLKDIHLEGGLACAFVAPEASP